jgi:SAM-dependent methyltransferase
VSGSLPPDLSRLARFTEPFPTRVRERASALANDPSIPFVVLRADPLAPLFRRNARSCLAAAARELARARAERVPPARVAWLVVNEAGQGLDAFEVEAVLAGEVWLEVLEQVSAGPTESRTLAIGRLRETALGLWAAIPDAAAPEAEAVARSLEALARPCVPIAAVAISRPTAEAWLLQPDATAPRALRALLDANPGALALRVPADRSRAALADLASEKAALERLGGAALRWVSFDDPAAAGLGELARAVAAAGFEVDASLRHADASSRPLTSAACFVPQAFDIRTPAPGQDAVLLEMVRVPIETLAPSRLRAWLERLVPAFATQRPAQPGRELARLLDHKRIERYNARMAGSTELMQRYAEYRVYNWPAPAPPLAAMLLDVGELDRPSAIRAALSRTLARLPPRDAWRRPASRARFLEAARAEALERLAQGARAVLQEQHEAHTYLSAIPVEEPLREDIRAFAAALPAALGRVLEIGSGRGQLARHLRARSTSYVCCDASPPLLRDAPRPGVLADIHVLPFHAASFDTIVANNVLEHAYDPVGCLGEVRRVLRDGGRLQAFIPLDGLDPRHEVRSHLWKADARSIELAVEASGLRLVELEVVDIYALGVQGAFPSCDGKVARVVAERAPREAGA